MDKNKYKYIIYIEKLYEQYKYWFTKKVHMISVRSVNVVGFSIHDLGCNIYG